MTSTKNIRIDDRVRITNGGLIYELDGKTGIVTGIGEMCGIPQYVVKLDNPISFEGEAVIDYSTEAIWLEVL